MLIVSSHCWVLSIRQRRCTGEINVGLIVETRYVALRILLGLAQVVVLLLSVDWPLIRFLVERY